MSALRCVSPSPSQGPELIPAPSFNARLELLRKREEIMLRRHEITAERVADPHEQAAIVARNERGAAASEHDRNMLRMVNAALERLDSGDYGECSDCGEQITRKRLQALPWAERCVRCAEKQERLG
jgi:DnaK suppressor protein